MKSIYVPYPWYLPIRSQNFEFGLIFLEYRSKRKGDSLTRLLFSSAQEACFDDKTKDILILRLGSFFLKLSHCFYAIAIQADKNSNAIALGR